MELEIAVALDPGWDRSQVEIAIVLLYGLFGYRIAALYIVANLALGLHLFHGAWSLFQSLGLNNPRFNKARRNFAAAFAAIIVVGNVSFPIAVLAGVVGH